MKYDVIVVGAGPAGLMAARELEKNKINYIVIDPKKEIGRPIRCAEGTREKEFIELFGSTKFDFVKNTAREHLSFVGKQHVNKFVANFIELDRAQFEKWLAKPLKGKIMFSMKCKDVIIGKECIEVITDKGSLEAEMAILAYGTNFDIQRKYGMLKRKVLYMPGWGGIFKNHNMQIDKFYYFFEDRYAGYFWVFPKDKETANMGFGGHDLGGKIKEIFYALAKEYGFKNLKLLEEYSGVFPSVGPIEKTYTDRLIAVGNAAGQGNAFSGEGVYYGLECGRIAGIAAAEACKAKRFDQKFLKNYETMWRKKVGQELTNSRVVWPAFAVAYRYDLYKQMMQNLSVEEVGDLGLHGKIPLRVRICLSLIQLLGIRHDLVKALPSMKRSIIREIFILLFRKKIINDNRSIASFRQVE